MNPLLKEIEDELKRTRLDKGRLYNLLTKIVENCSGGGAAPAAPVKKVTPVAAPAPVAAPRAPQSLPRSTHVRTGQAPRGRAPPAC